MQRVRASIVDSGQSVAVVVMVVAVIVATLTGVTRLGSTLIDRQTAVAAADAVALAAARHGVAQADSVATANHAELVSVRVVDADTVEVVVRVGSVSASARATRAP